MAKGTLPVEVDELEEAVRETGWQVLAVEAATGSRCYYSLAAEVVQEHCSPIPRTCQQVVIRDPSSYSVPVVAKIQQSFVSFRFQKPSCFSHSPDSRQIPLLPF